MARIVRARKIEGVNELSLKLRFSGIIYILIEKWRGCIQPVKEREVSCSACSDGNKMVRFLFFESARGSVSW